MTRVLFIGCDKGAWQMRGRQIANALPRAIARAKPTPAEWDWADVVVLVKRAAEVWWREAAACGKPVVWDVLDFWRQPEWNGRTRDELVRTVEQIKRECRASVLIAATKAMAQDIGGVYLRHHSRIGLVPTPPRATMKVIGYDGSPRYLGSWAPALERACARLGLSFVINPPDLASVDVLVALRGDEWDGWACRQWKSGVKYANAIAAGRPIITQACAAYVDVRPCGVEVVDHEALAYALEALAQPGNRDFPYEHGLEVAPHYRVEAIAAQYERIIRSVARSAA